MELAGFGRRYLAFVLDILFLELTGALILTPLITDGATGSLVMSLPGDGVSESAFPVFLAQYFFLGAALWSIYFTCFNSVAGRTPGKRLLGLWVCHPDGKSLSAATALGRLWVSLIAGTLTLGLSYSWAGWDRWRQGWHDKLFKTVVIQNTTRSNRL
ncbi:MAG: RDD family protein [Nitrospina sp.]|nr:RDD family protein [Nitrospina sp.]